MESVALEGIGLDKSECSIDKNGGPCSSKKVIEKIADVIEFNLKDAIEEEKKSCPCEKKNLLPTADTKEAIIIRTAAEVLGCNSEVCVLNAPEVKQAVGNETIKKELAVNFKELGPRDSNAWLSNVNLDRTLQKWAVEFPDLYVWPYCMSDFYKTKGSLATIKVVDILNGTASQEIATGRVTRKCTRMACVLNTDVHTGRGIHWVCVFVDCSKSPYSIEYWNSAGNPPFNSVVRWMEETRADLKKYKPNISVNTYSVTSVPHQESNSECGVYTLFYIRKRLEGTPIQYFMDKRIPDEVMTEFRKYLFRK
jgi:hypothetical protein